MRQVAAIFVSFDHHPYTSSNLPTIYIPDQKGRTFYFECLPSSWRIHSYTQSFRIGSMYRIYRSIRHEEINVALQVENNRGRGKRGERTARRVECLRTWPVRRCFDLPFPSPL